jgi:phosphoenolpyruvate synthase/pyruvate phosphate dikinase
MNRHATSINVPYVLPLPDLTRADVSRVGAKAANLGELARAGFPVPDGFALTTQAFDDFVTLNELGETQTPEGVLRAEMPPHVQTALRAVVENFDGSLLAVRSSGVAEDLEGASFAGQYETILGVHGHEALPKAVRQCWASAFSARVAAYKENSLPDRI